MLNNMSLENGVEYTQTVAKIMGTDGSPGRMGGSHSVPHRVAIWASRDGVRSGEERKTKES